MTGSPYDRHVGRYGAELAAGMLAATGITAGMRVLDVGAGTGALTAALAAVTGPERVTALDPSEPFAAVCRARVPGADVRIGHAEALPFAAGTFDAVLAQLVVNLVGDPPGAVAEMRRVLRPGGVAAACVWQAGSMPLLDAFWGAAEEVAPAAVATTPERQRVGHPAADDLTAVFAAAGFAEVVAGRLSATTGYEDFEDLWAPFAAGVGRSGQVCAGLAPGDRAALRARVHERLGSPADRFELTASAWVVTARA